jgi:hypothetical protein
VSSPTTLEAPAPVAPVAAVAPVAPVAPIGGAAPAAPPPVPSTPPAGDIPPLKPWHQEIWAEDGKFADGWQDKLPDDFAEDRALLGRFGDLKGITKALKDNMAAARAKSEGLVKVPGADATPEEVTAYHRSIGVPEKPEDYGVKAPEKLPDGVSWDEAMATKFASVAHAAGLTPVQVAKLQEFQVGYVGEQIGAAREAAAQAMAAEKVELQKAFGQGLPKAVDHAQRLAKQEGLNPEIFDPQSPNFWGVEALAFASRVASKLGEDRLIPGAAVRNLSGGALAKDIVTNPENPLHAKYHAGDAQVNAQVNALYAQGG